MASTPATSVAASVEGTSVAPNPSRSSSAQSIGRRVVFFVSLLASTVAAHHAHAEPVAHAAQAHLAVSVNVVSTCAIDSSAAYSVRCATPTAAIVHEGTIQGLRSDDTHTGRYTLTTVNF
ncbi:MAG: hypothetical protein ACHQ53_11995 [Polyangiales bacterium]